FLEKAFIRERPSPALGSWIHKRFLRDTKGISDWVNAECKPHDIFDIKGSVIGDAGSDYVIDVWCLPGKSDVIWDLDTTDVAPNDSSWPTVAALRMNTRNYAIIGIRRGSAVSGVHMLKKRL